MSKRLFLGTLIAVLLFIFIGSVATGVYLFTKINMNINAQSKADEDKKYHIAVIVDGYHSTYSTQFLDGLQKGANEGNIAFEYWEIKANNVLEECLKQLDMAITSKVDGVILHAFNDERYEVLINKAEDAGIPVVILHEDVPSSRRLTYVGINRYNIGAKVAEIFQQNMPNGGNIALIEKNLYGNNSGLTDQNNVDLLVMGMQEVISKNTALNLSQVKYTDVGLLSAEAVTTDIIHDESSIKGIFCADGQDTLGVLQVLTDFNRLNDVIIIGFDDLPEIVNYIDKGLIKASVVADYEMIGYEAVKALENRLNNKVVSSYIMTDIKIIQKSDIEAVKEE